MNGLVYAALLIALLVLFFFVMGPIIDALDKRAERRARKRGELADDEDWATYALERDKKYVRELEEKTGRRWQ